MKGMKTKEEILNKYVKDSQWYAPVCDSRIHSAMQEYSDQQNAELKKENEELKMQIESMIKMDNKIIQHNNLKSKADEMCEALNSLSKWNDEWPPNRIYSMGQAKEIENRITQVVVKAKQAIENYKK